MLLRITSRQQSKVVTLPRRLKRRLFPWLVPIFAITFLCGYKQVESYFLEPKAIFVLGGSTIREKYAAQFAQKHPNLPIWVSSGSPEEYAQWVFSEAGIDQKRIHLDYHAVDTVTNFTELADKLKAEGIDSVYLITSDYHMRRAQVVGEIVFGSRGISIKPIPIPSDRETEPIEKVLRDGARAILWVTTGHTGATLRDQSEKIKIK
jgi:uncharacterized SAM-binding protein YcdF (DUF218 family)